MSWADINEAFSHLGQPLFLLIGGAVVLLALILFALTRRGPKAILAYTSEAGDVRVRRSAIVQLVRTSCEQIPEVAKPVVRIRTGGESTDFEVRLRLSSGARLRNIEQTLQSHLRKALRDNLGIEDLGRIDIVATGFESGTIEAEATDGPDGGASGAIGPAGPQPKASRKPDNPGTPHS